MTLLVGIGFLVLTMIIVAVTIVYILRWDERRTMGKDNYKILKDFQRELANFTDLRWMK